MDQEIDIAAQIRAVHREVTEEQRDGEDACTVVATRGFPTTLEDLWDAVTTADRLVRWFAPVTGDLRLGGRYKIEGNAEGEITACDPPSYLALTWEYDGEVSWVEARLWSEGEMAHLELRHAARPGPHWDQFGPGAGGVGWDLALLGLGLYMATGTSIDPETAGEWMAGDEAKEFMRRSNEAWRDAYIASGAPAEVAMAAEAATIEAYTGGG